MITEKTRINVGISVAAAVLLAGGTAVWKASDAWAEAENAIEKNAETNSRIVDLIESNEERRKDESRGMRERVERLERQDQRFLLLLDRLTRIEESDQ